MTLPPALDLKTYRAYRRDPAQWLPALAEVAHRHGFSTDLTPVAAGSNLIAMGRDVVIKCYAPMFAGDFDVERTALSAVQGRLGVPVPEMLHEGTLHGWPCLVQRRLSGIMMESAWASIPQPERVHLAEQVGSVVAALRQVSVVGLEALTPNWTEFVRRQAEGAMALQREAGWSEAWLEQLPDYLTFAEAEATREFEPVLLHADLTEHNMLVEERDERWWLTGVIDFADAMVGAPEYELMAAWFGGLDARPELQRPFLRACGYDDEALNAELRRRASLYVVLHRFSHMPGLMKRAGVSGAASTFEQLEAALWPLSGASDMAAV